MTGDTHEPTAVGWAMLTVAAALPEQLARHLLRLLHELLGGERDCDLREVRLGLVFELIWQLGRPASVKEYDDERERRLALGEDWPDRSTLCDHFGGWIAVQKAALDLYRVGTVARVSATGPQAPDDRGADAYSRQEIIDALIRFRETNGYWPVNAEEYRVWAVVERRLRTAAYRRARTRAENTGRPTDGIPKARVPGLSPIYRHFRKAGFHRAVRVAERAWRERGSDE